MNYQNIGNGTFVLGECLEVMAQMPDNCADMILCDLPYGTTACKWDVVIPFDELWKQYWRIAKENAPIVLTAAQPFTTKLIESQFDYYKYLWYWVKNRKTGNMLAKKQPLRCVEEILIFGKSKIPYNPQLGNPTKHGGTKTPKSKAAVYALSEASQKDDYVRPLLETPNHILNFNTERGIHPTQKPVALFEYLIKTYSNEGDLVLDNCAGSGTTAIAAENTKRRWACIEQNEEYANKAIERIKAHIENPA